MLPREQPRAAGISSGLIPKARDISSQRSAVARSICKWEVENSHRCRVEAHDMAPAIEILLPVKALTQTQTSLSLLIERAASGVTAAFEQHSRNFQPGCRPVRCRPLARAARPLHGLANGRLPNSSLNY